MFLGIEGSQLGIEVSQGPSTLGTQCALNRIESGLSASTLNVHPLPEVVSIRIELDRAIARCA